MFGLGERGRLAMYEKTLSIARGDVASEPNYVEGLCDALAVFHAAISRASQGRYVQGLQDTLWGTSMFSRWRPVGNSAAKRPTQ